MVISEVERLAAFSVGGRGGNPAGVVVCNALPPASRMQEIAADVGFSETAFAAPVDGAWRVRYFAPRMEVPFCGHATIALGATLADRHGDGVFRLHLKETAITVEGNAGDAGLHAALHSPATHSERAAAGLLDRALALFGYRSVDLDPRLPPAVMEAGARHLALALSDRRQLATMRYDLNEGRELMLAYGLVTISLLHAETQSRFHVRNPFAAGGVYEDPATGAAAAAWAGYLRDLGWPHGGDIEIVQGEDMGVPCRLHARITPQRGAGIRVSGEVLRYDDVARRSSSCPGRPRDHRHVRKLAGRRSTARSPVPVLPDLWPKFAGPRLYYPNRLASPPLRAFIEVCGQRTEDPDSADDQVAGV